MESVPTVSDISCYTSYKVTLQHSVSCRGEAVLISWDITAVQLGLCSDLIILEKGSKSLPLNC